MKELTNGFISVKWVYILVEGLFCSWSTLSFPSMPQWLGTQQKRTRVPLSLNQWPEQVHDLANERVLVFTLNCLQTGHWVRVDYNIMMDLAHVLAIVQWQTDGCSLSCKKWCCCLAVYWTVVGRLPHHSGNGGSQSACYWRVRQSTWLKSTDLCTQISCNMQLKWAAKNAIFAPNLGFLTNHFNCQKTKLFLTVTYVLHYTLQKGFVLHDTIYPHYHQTHRSIGLYI